MKYVYTVSDENHGVVAHFSNEQAAKDCVEHISVVDYGMRTDEEIFEDRWGNQMVWWGMYEVYDSLEERDI